MMRARGLFGRGISACAVVFVVALSLPLLAWATVMLRPLLMLAMAVGLVGGAVLCLHPGSRCWLERHLREREPASPGPGRA